MSKRRGQHVPQAEQAIREQAQAEQILRSVQAAEHYLYLKKKFGARSGTTWSATSS